LKGENLSSLFHFLFRADETICHEGFLKREGWNREKLNIFKHANEAYKKLPPETWQRGLASGQSIFLDWLGHYKT